MTPIHKRQPYMRPRSMGGDVFHPLCLATITGWSGKKVATFPMTDAAASVTCPNCLRHMAAGGMASRKAELMALLCPNDRVAA